MGEKHSALVLNIETFAKEDEAYELLNSLSMSLPILIMVTWVLDALLAGVYLKWLHPWRIILQEVSSLGLEFRLFTFTSQEPDQWEPETDNEADIEQVDKKVVLNLILIYLSGNPGGYS